MIWESIYQYGIIQMVAHASEERNSLFVASHVSDKGREAPELTDVVPECGHPVFIRLHILWRSAVF